MDLRIIDYGRRGVRVRNSDPFAGKAPELAVEQKG